LDSESTFINDTGFSIGDGQSMSLSSILSVERKFLDFLDISWMRWVECFLFNFNTCWEVITSMSIKMGRLNVVFSTSF
jgi:hypothetical protein